MNQPSVSSRRAVVAGATALAASPRPGAAKKPKPKPPLAFATVRVTSSEVDTSHGPMVFAIAYDLQWAWPAGSQSGSATGNANIVAAGSAAVIQQTLLTSARDIVSALTGSAVPAAQVAIVLL